MDSSQQNGLYDRNGLVVVTVVVVKDVIIVCGWSTCVSLQSSSDDDEDEVNGSVVTIDGSSTTGSCFTFSLLLDWFVSTKELLGIVYSHVDWCSSDENLYLNRLDISVVVFS